MLFLENITQKQIELLQRTMAGPMRQAISDSFVGLAEMHKCLGAAMCGDIVLSVTPPQLQLSATRLNAAAADTVKISGIATLGYEVGAEGVHKWANFAPLFTATKGTVASSAIAAPTFAEVSFVEGLARFIVTLDTDAGVTKTYVAGEELELTFQVNALDILGGATVTPLTVIVTVI
jgi:hypothetical protein